MDQFYITLSIFSLRVAMGLRLLFPAWKMIMEGPAPTKKYLLKVKGPFAHFFHRLAGRKWAIYLNAWSLLICGFLLVFGIFVRPAALVGGIIMLLYWLSKFPHKEGVINENIIYAAVLFLLGMLNAGIWWGFDFLLLQFPKVLQLYQSNPWMSWIL